jgi:hypothetical protein
MSALNISTADWIQLAVVAVLLISLIITAVQGRIQQRSLKDQVALLERQLRVQQIASETQLALMNQQIVRQFEWSTRQAALDFATGRNASLREARIALDRAFKNVANVNVPLTMEQINSAIDGDQAVYTHIITLLGNLENMALAIYAQIADESVAFETMAGTTLQYITRFREFINHRRDHNNPRAYDYLLELEQRWSNELQQAMYRGRPIFSNLREPFSYNVALEDQRTAERHVSRN